MTNHAMLGDQEPRSTVPQPPKPFESVEHKLEGLQHFLSEIHDRLLTVTERVVGVRPHSGGDDRLETAAASCLADRMHRDADVLHNLAQKIGEQVSRLEDTF